MYEMFLHGKKKFYDKQNAYVTINFHLNYAMPHLHEQLILHTLHIYKLSMKNISISLSTITYKRRINIVLCTMISGRARDVWNVSTW
jgi:hypothetical protein